jgi:hypothetical protein
VLLAHSPLDAVYAAGVEINQTDEVFLRNIPGAVWTDLKSHIIAAYTLGLIPQLDVQEGPAYRLAVRSVEDNVLPLTIVGPIPRLAN